MNSRLAAGFAFGCLSRYHYHKMHIWIYSLVLAVALIAPQLVSSSFAQERLPPPVAKNIKSAAASGQHRSYSLQSAVTMAIVHYPGHVEEIIATAVDAAPQSRDQLVQTMAWAFPNYKGRILAGAGYLETSSSSPASSGQSKPARSSRPVETASNTHQAESDKGLYWGVGGGIANLMDVELVESEDITGDLDVDTGMIVRGVLGYDFANNFRADFELAYRKNDIQNISVTISGISAAGNLYGKITALSYMLNGYYDFDLTGKPRIIDGDTIEIAGQRIRLHGIDAPEMKQTCKTPSGKEQKCGLLSKQFLSDLLRNLEVTCKGEKKDRYARLVAVCSIGWMDINEQIVMEGWALAYRKYSEDYVRAENYAKAMRRGVWKTEFVPPWKWRQN